MPIQRTHFSAPGGGPIYSLAIHPDGGELAVGQQGDDTGSPILSLWSFPDGKLRKVIENENFGIVVSVRYSPDGGKIAYLNTNLDICFYDRQTGRTERPTLENIAVKWLDYASKSDRLAISGAYAQVWDGKRGRVVWTAPGPAAGEDRSLVPRTAALSADGRLAAVTDPESAAVTVYDIEKGHPVQRLEGAPRQSRWLSFDWKGRYLGDIEWFSNGTVIWDLSSGRAHLPKVFNLERESFWSMSFHPGSEYVALGMLSGYVIVARLADGEYVLCERAHNGRVWDLCFSADGKHLVSSSEDGSAAAWEIG